MGLFFMPQETIFTAKTIKIVICLAIFPIFVLQFAQTQGNILTDQKTGQITIMIKLGLKTPIRFRNVASNLFGINQQLVKRINDTGAKTTWVLFKIWVKAPLSLNDTNTKAASF